MLATFELSGISWMRLACAKIVGSSVCAWHSATCDQMWLNLRLVTASGSSVKLPTTYSISCGSA